MLERIMVVDDSALIHQMYRLVMNVYKCEIIDAMDGREALDILANRQDIQLILLDINMPVMNGLRFMEKAASLGITRTIPIIIISTEGKEEDTVKGLALGARGYLKKPFQPADLHALIGKIMEVGGAPAKGGYASSPAVAGF